MRPDIYKVLEVLNAENAQDWLNENYDNGYRLTSVACSEKYTIFVMTLMSEL